MKHKVVTVSLLLCFGLIILWNGVVESTNMKTEILDDPINVKSIILASTLDGSLTALGRLNGRIRWVTRDEPMISVPSENIKNSIKVPHFLPDPRSGSLYLLGAKGQLKKLPFTIPQLVSMSPCRSTEGLLYTGKKMDVWLSLDPVTGEKSEVFSLSDKTCPSSNKGNGAKLGSGVLLGKSEYVISMADGQRKWNVTFHDYSSVDMSPQLSQDYGSLLTYSKSSGQLLWEQTLSSPIVALYSLSPLTTPHSASTLLSLPFTSLSLDTLYRLNPPPGAKGQPGDRVQPDTKGQPGDRVQPDTKGQPGDRGHREDRGQSGDKGQGGEGGNLLPTLYVGECPSGLYALASLVDGGVRTIGVGGVVGLIEGPGEGGGNDVSNASEDAHETHEDDYLLLGHYELPDSSTYIKQIGNIPQILTHDPNESQNESNKIIPSPSPDYNSQLKSDHLNENEKASISHQLDPAPLHNFQNKDNGNGKNNGLPEFIKMRSDTSPNKFPPPSPNNERQEKGDKEKPFIILTTAAITVAAMTTITTLGFLTARKFQWKKHSFASSKLMSSSDGTLVSVGKITFDTSAVLGKGCEGTFVYRGTFERREVAVKRILPQCFDIADREVDLLKESDQHPNVIRYFCTETDGQFRYIALELCSATLNEWVEGKFINSSVSGMSILKEATEGLSYLHKSSIVHRDIKPPNVLLSLSLSTGIVKAMISDFGLCKKLSVGRASFSRRSGGIPGTEGWIAPEMLSNSDRTTYAVDVFSLGCVYYYILTHGDHPFGDPFRRQMNICSGSYNLDGVSGCTKGSLALIERMIESEGRLRPDLNSVTSHPLFWTPTKILNFFIDVSDWVEKEEEDSCLVLKWLESEGSSVVRGDWREHICDEVKNDLRKYRTYKGHSIRDLLRALRNKKNHYRELSEEAQLSLGSIPSEFVDYWTSRFPSLLPYTWTKFELLKNEPMFSHYYSPHFSWSLSPPPTHLDDIQNNFNNFMDLDSNWRNSSNPPSPAKNTDKIERVLVNNERNGVNNEENNEKVGENGENKLINKKKNSWRGGRYGGSPRWRKNGQNIENGVPSLKKMNEGSWRESES